MWLEFGMLMRKWWGRLEDRFRVDSLEYLAKEFRLHPLDRWGLSKVLSRGSDSQIMNYLER